MIIFRFYVSCISVGKWRSCLL